MTEQINDLNEKNEIKNYIQKIKLQLENKNILRKEICSLKGKLLIEKQIIEEHKRKIEETNEYYKDQIKEVEENRDNKEEYIKIFENKLKEVEIYIQKNTKNLVNSKYEIFKDFKINNFIEKNNILVSSKEKLIKQ